MQHKQHLKVFSNIVDKYSRYIFSSFFHGWNQMATRTTNSTNRKGQFLWREPAAQQHYISTLKKRIAENYYFEERVFSHIADEIAPVLDEMTGDR